MSVSALWCYPAAVISTLIYPIYANWVWGGGWLSTLGRDFGLGHGHVDLAGCSVVHMTGGIIAFIGYVTARYGKPDVTMLCNGMLAGLVAITASCAFVSAPAAVLIGAVAGVLVVVSTLFSRGAAQGG